MIGSLPRSSDLSSAPLALALISFALSNRTRFTWDVDQAASLRSASRVGFFAGPEAGADGQHGMVQIRSPRWAPTSRALLSRRPERSGPTRLVTEAIGGAG